jgi:hypothetical protein
MLLVLFALLLAVVLMLMIALPLLLWWAFPSSGEESARPAPVPLPLRRWSVSDRLFWTALSDWMRSKPLRLTHDRSGRDPV